MIDYSKYVTSTYSSTSPYSSWRIRNVIEPELEESVEWNKWDTDYQFAYQSLGRTILNFTWPKKKQLEYSEEDFMALLNGEFEVPADEL